MNEKLISFDIQSDFAFFKKPDYNDGVLLSYNMLHKPALLGVLGAIIGLAGYKEKGQPPEYYNCLKDLLVGIEPLEGKHEKGNFKKTSVKYTNTVGYANKDGNLLVEETMLISPGYRCYLLLSVENIYHNKIYEYLKLGNAEFIPYLGKNEFHAWFNDSFNEYEYKSFIPESDFIIKSLFIKEDSIRRRKVGARFSFSTMSMANKGGFCYFERLPIGFDEVLNQYELAEFAYTNWTLKKDGTLMDNLYLIKAFDDEQVIQLF